jgi:hypothetical protein
MSGKGRNPGKPSDHKKVSWAPGQKVRCSFSLGKDVEKLRKADMRFAETFLKDGKEYTVKKMWKGEAAELVYLEEVKADIGFRVELFEEVKDV